MEDIPEAIRDQSNTNKNKFQPDWLSPGLFSLIFFAIAIGFYLWWGNFQNPKNTSNNATKIEESQANQTPNTPPINAENTPQTENILGHLSYQEADAKQLKAITPDGRIKLRQKAAQKFLAMQKDARLAGIILVPISGFRSKTEQEYLFFKVKEQRAQTTNKRAEVSAPPGYSEHHTGYAVDIGDGRLPATNLSQSFENTPAFNWLKKNGSKYSFELSFSRDNLQGISYEPWHWRYVGDVDSLETFYKARNLKQKLN